MAEDNPWPELGQMVNSLLGLAPRLAKAAMTMPDAAGLNGQLFQLIALAAALATEGEMAVAKRDSQKLAELVEIKSDFLRLTTHELRRPLGLLNGYLSLIREETFGPVPDSLQSCLQKIEAGTSQMAALVEGLAVVARLEDRGELLRRQPTRIGYLVAEAVDELTPEAQARRIKIERRLPDPDILAATDRHHLRIAVANLLGNAIKYTKEGTTIVVTVSATAERAQIAVSDQGPGIEPAEADRVFERWHRGPEVEARGLGLGLYIVKTIAELHGGGISLTSTPGQGATFTISLPR